MSTINNNVDMSGLRREKCQVSDCRCSLFSLAARANSCRNCSHAAIYHKICRDAQPASSLMLDSSRIDMADVRRMASEIRRQNQSFSSPGGARPGAGRKSFLDAPLITFNIRAAIELDTTPGLEKWRFVGSRQFITVESPATIPKVLSKCKDVWNLIIQNDGTDDGLEDHYLIQSVSGPKIQRYEDLKRSKNMFYVHKKFVLPQGKKRKYDSMQHLDETHLNPESSNPDSENNSVFSFCDELDQGSPNPPSERSDFRDLRNTNGPKIEQLQQILAVSAEEAKIALDLHDDLDSAANYIIQFSSKVCDRPRDICNPPLTTKNHFSNLRRSHREDVHLTVDRRGKSKAELHTALLCFYKGDPFSDDVNLLKNLHVTFANEEGCGSGLREEYASIIRDIFENGLAMCNDVYLIFEGQKDHLMPKMNASLRHNGYYKYIVRMFCHLLLLSDGEKYAFAGLSPFFKRILCGAELEEAFFLLTAEDITDYDDQILFKKLCDGKIDLTVQQTERINKIATIYGIEHCVASTSTNVSNSSKNCLQLPRTESDAIQLAESILRILAIDMRKAEIDIFVQQVRKICNLSACSDAEKILFPSTLDISRSMEEIMRMFVFEECCHYQSHFEQYLRYLEDKKSLGTFLKFITGSNYPGGDLSITVRVDSTLSDFETIVTQVCTSEIIINSHDLSYEHFRETWDVLLADALIFSRF